VFHCVMFDLGHVLMPFYNQKFFDFVKAHQALGAIGSERFLDLACVMRFDIGDIGPGEFFSETTRHLQLVNVNEEDFWLHFCGVMEPDLKMLALKRMLKENGFKLALVSNINETHFEYARLKYPDVFTDFDYLSLSFQLHVRKPNLKMYRIPAERLGAKPEECLLIDDMQINIDAFERWGGAGHHYNVVNDAFCQNGRLEEERRKLLLRMVNLGMLSLNQAGGIMRIDF